MHKFRVSPKSEKLLKKPVVTRDSDVYFKRTALRTVYHFVFLPFPKDPSSYPKSELERDSFCFSNLKLVSMRNSNLNGTQTCDY